MFNSVVIATDIDAGSDRAIPVGTELARRGRLPVEVLTVVSEPSAPVDDTRRRRARRRTVSVTRCASSTATTSRRRLLTVCRVVTVRCS